MSKPRFYWYEIARKMVIRYPNYKNEPHSKQERIFKNAIDRVIEETLCGRDGDVKIKAVTEILWQRTKTYEGFALDSFYDWRTVQNWVTAFINKVGREAGY